jgi:hypothetical protein
MRIQQLLEHHGIARNPFAEEDAQTDPVFKDFCIDTTYHPAWDKVYGDPSEPATAVVFGEKGSGKTALRLQIARHLHTYNKEHPGEGLFILHYDDFNPFLDRFQTRVGSRKRADKVLNEWKLWDHMDSILSIGVTGLVDRILEVKHPSTAVECDIDASSVDKLDRHQARDLLLLATFYDQSTAETFIGRWERLRKRLRFSTILAQWDFGFGIAWTLGAISTIISMWYTGNGAWLPPLWLNLIFVVLGWAPWCWRFLKSFFAARGVVNRMRVSNRESGELRRALMRFKPKELASQPIPNKNRTDDRYELLLKFLGVIDSLGYGGTVILIDRLDEPHLINGSAELMKQFLWSMLDNKFLKQPSVGLKMMLPIELTRFIDREEKEFYQRARLDKQNMIRQFEWSGEALLDVTNARIRACAEDGKSPSLRKIVSENITEQRLLDALRSLRTPRHLFKFIYRLLVAHCNSHSDDNPKWQISSETFESTLATSLRDQDAFDRGVGAG